MSRRGDTKIERLVLNVSLAEAQRDLGLGKLRTEIEGMRAILIDVQIRKEIESLMFDLVKTARIDVNAVFRRFNAKIRVAYLLGHGSDLIWSGNKRCEIMNL